jgi:hypothetical protein
MELLKQTVLSDEAVAAPDESDYNLNLTGVYQDSVTRQWAMQMCRKATRLAGEQRVQNTWYDANALGDPATFLEAVRAALVADVIVVSLYAAEELPIDLYVWFEAWLPRRLPRAGALTALIGVAEPLDSPSVRTLDYLQAVARKAQLDFIPRKHRRPDASPADSSKTMAPPAGAGAQGMQALYGRHSETYCHWGLNE